MAMLACYRKGKKIKLNETKQKINTVRQPARKQ
jgi:hypothetical protein